MGSFQRSAERFYRRLLGLYPTDFRDEWGEEMTQLFAERSRRERLSRLLADVAVDLVKTAPKEHLDMLVHDLKTAVRSLRKNPAFTLVAAGSLAIGIGGSAAIFSLADALILRPLPVPRPGEVVSVRGREAGSPTGMDYESVSLLDYRDFRDRSRSFAGLAAYEEVTLGLGQEGTAVPQLTIGLAVSGDFFDVLGVAPEHGRAFLPEEDVVPGRNPVAVLSNRVWKTAFGGDPAIVGRTVRVNGRPLTVVGIAPASFTGLDQFVGPAVYVPLAMLAELRGDPGTRVLTRREERVLAVKGRLRRGVSLRAANAELSAIAAALERDHPDTNRGRGVSVKNELAARLEASPSNAAICAMLALLVAFVLLIACANVATLLLARSASRERELAIRLAVGASRPRLVRQLLTESVVLALLGGTLGLLVAEGGIRLFSTFRLPTDLPIVLSFRLDGRVLAISLFLSLGSVLLFGVAPAFRSVRPDLVPALKGAAGGGRGRLRGRRALVAVEVALSVVVLACATNLLTGFSRVLGGSPGFKKSGVLTAGVDPTVLRLPPDKVHEIYRSLVDRARALPGVRSVALVSALPMGNAVYVVSYVPEGVVLPKGETALSSLGAVVDESYFTTFGVPIVRGRAFGASDRADAPRVVIVNEELARRRWPDQDPLGKRIRLDRADGPLAEVVGVTRTHKYLWVGEEPADYVYIPFAQSDRQRMTLLLEAAGDPAALAAPLRDAVRAVSPDLPVHDVRTIEDFYYMRAVSVPNLIVEIVGAMGISGLALAVVGLYALVAYSVSRRTREIGIRMAIGASARDILSMVLRQGIGVTAAGIAAGLLATYGVLKVLASVIWGMGSADPLAVLVPAALLVAVTLAATLVPARRAARVDPNTALRCD